MLHLSLTMNSHRVKDSQHQRQHLLHNPLRLPSPTPRAYVITSAGQVDDGGPQSGGPRTGQHRLEVSLLGHGWQQARAVLAERGQELALQQPVVLVPLLL